MVSMIGSFTVTLRSFVVQALLRAVLVCAAFYVGFIVVDARAQQTPAQATEPASNDGLFVGFIKAFGDGAEQASVHTFSLWFGGNNA